MITFRHKGDFNRTRFYLDRVKSLFGLGYFDAYGKAGVDALAAATPIDTGKTASSWSYETSYTKRGVRLTFNNSNIQNGVPIAIILQYGHGTRQGGYVEGRDYINPAVQPLFDKMSNEMWEEVTKR